MFRFRLPTGRSQVELIANGNAQRLPFHVIGPATEVAFVEELVEQEFGSLKVEPAKLFGFLQTDPWIQESFQDPQLIEGNLAPASPQERDSDETFQEQPLGQKLVSAGVLKLEELEQLLLDYQPFANSQRFGEFLRLNLKVSEPMLELLMNPALYAERGFNDQRLGERLRELNLVSEKVLNQALAEQQVKGGRLGEILARDGVISEQMARFFAEAHLAQSGTIEFTS